MSEQIAVQQERRRAIRWMPIVLLGSAAVCAGAAAAEQIASKVPEIQQMSVLMSAGQRQVGGFSAPHAELTPAEDAAVTNYQAAIEDHYRDRDLDWAIAIRLAEAAIIAEGARLVLRRYEARIPAVGTVPTM